MPTPTSNLLVIGVGNLLMMDDGIGCQLADALKALAIPGVRVMDVGTSVIHALDELEQARAVMFMDAFYGGGAPGSLYLMDARSVLRPQVTASLHEVGLGATLRELGPAHQDKPLALLGVEPACIDFGMELSPTLSAAFPALLDTAVHLARTMTQSRFALPWYPPQETGALSFATAQGT